MEITTDRTAQITEERITIVGVIADVPLRPLNPRSPYRWRPETIHITWHRIRREGEEWGSWSSARGANVAGVKVRANGTDGTPYSQSFVFESNREFGAWVSASRPSDA